MIAAVARRSSLSAATVLLALATFYGCEGRDHGVGGLTPNAAAGKNLLFISLDTVRADRLGCYGREAAETPVLDGLASGGVRFDQAFTTAPITLPSHVTMLTGQLPPNHGVRDNAEYRLAPEAHTLAEQLSDAGYDTAAFVSAFVLESRYGLDQGFDVYEDREGFGSGPGAAGRILERDAETVTNQAGAWIENVATADSDRPFFLWVHYFDPHLPYRAPEPWGSRFKDDPYDGEIAYVDSQIGRLLETLARVGARSDTLIVVVADHGEGLGEHGEDTHAMMIYDSVMRVPLIVAGPAIPTGVVVGESIVSTADLLPTALSLLGVADEHERDGIDLTRRTPDPDRTVYLESLTPYLHHGWSPLFALHRRSDKYIEAPIAEYYDVESDPAETDNLDPEVSGGEADRRDALRDELTSMLDSWPSYAEVAEAAETLDTETLEKLRALGYVGGGAPVNPTLADPKSMMPILQRIHRAGALFGAGRRDEAVDELLEAAEASPGNRTVLHTLGTLYLMLGRERESEAVFRRYQAIRPSADVSAMLAQIRLNVGTPEGAEEARALLDQALALDPEYGVAHLTRGDLLASEGDRDGAIAAWESAATHDPTLARASAARIRRATR